MRLWHQKLIKKLPRQQLLGQHREICALRGNSWGKKHSTVDYVFTHPIEHLIAFHMLVMYEMTENRGYNVDDLWWDHQYRGKKLGFDKTINKNAVAYKLQSIHNIYPEHNDAYLNECLENLKAKGVIINDQ
jgi:uncharacterized protein (TIGR02328 family)